MLRSTLFGVVVILVGIREKQSRMDVEVLSERYKSTNKLVEQLLDIGQVYGTKAFVDSI